MRPCLHRQVVQNATYVIVYYSNKSELIKDPRFLVSVARFISETILKPYLVNILGTFEYRIKICVHSFIETLVMHC